MTGVDDEQALQRRVKKLRADISSVETRAESLEEHLPPDTALHLRWNLELARRAIEFQLQRDDWPA